MRMVQGLEVKQNHKDNPTEVKLEMKKCRKSDPHLPVLFFKSAVLPFPVFFLFKNLCETWCGGGSVSWACVEVRGQFSRVGSSTM